MTKRQVAFLLVVNMTSAPREFAHETLDAALYAIREEVGPLTRDAENPHFTSKFTSLPALTEKVDPIAWKHGVLIHHTLNIDVLRHELWFNGERTETYDILLPNPQGTAQGLGSAVTYMRRYDITTSLGLVADLDDDGNAASTAAPQAREPRPSPVPPAGRVGAAPRNPERTAEVERITQAFPGTSEIDDSF